MAAGHDEGAAAQQPPASNRTQTHNRPQRTTPVGQPSTARAGEAASFAEFDAAYVRRGLQRGRDAEIVRLRRWLSTRDPNSEAAQQHRRDAALKTWFHLGRLGLNSELTAAVLREEPAA